ncbi:MAG: hypothetical protein OWR52_07925 [Acidibacillus sp.]|nr:hypothetical protein [Acidibacillus sp.]
MDFEQPLERLEQLHEEIMTALIAGDAPHVERLVTEQCVILKRAAQQPIVADQVWRWVALKDKIVHQQVLIEQASNVMSYFLKQLYPSPTISIRG